MNHFTQWRPGCDEMVDRTVPKVRPGHTSVEDDAGVGLTTGGLFGDSSFEQASRLLERTGAGLVVLGPELEVLAVGPCAKQILDDVLATLAAPLASGGGAVESLRRAILRVQRGEAEEASVCILVLGDVRWGLCRVRCVPLGNGVALVVSNLHDDSATRERRWSVSERPTGALAINCRQITQAFSVPTDI